ncbi:MAG TPA: CPBP family intramembrane metalloprotease, partial [Citreicella sp.]|nr:CPBP family intramembrane metalloprotease [Citreicella sp.]
LLPPWPLSADLQPGLPPVTWLALLPLTLLALLVQTGSEEILFRGYLQSQLAARLPWPAVWLVLPSALFALGHHAPAIYGANAGLVTLWAFVFGLAMADLTARSGTLG